MHRLRHWRMAEAPPKTCVIWHATEITPWLLHQILLLLRVFLTLGSTSIQENSVGRELGTRRNP